MNLGADRPKAAVAAVDLHRGDLDMSVATMSSAPDVTQRVTVASERLIEWCRRVGMPVIHQVTSYREADEIRANPFWRTRAEDPTATRTNVMRHNIIGGPCCTVMPQLFDANDFVVNTKERYDCFVVARHQHDPDHRGEHQFRHPQHNHRSISMRRCGDPRRGLCRQHGRPELHLAWLACIRAAFGFVMNNDATMTLYELAPRHLTIP